MTAVPWSLVGFGDRLDEWIALEQPSDSLRWTAAEWVLSRFDDPYVGVTRQPGFSNLWFGVIPGTAHHPDQVVACSYWIEEGTRTVRCDSVATLSWPM